MTFLTDALLTAGVWVTEVTPSPTPTFGSYTGDEDLITPGVIGFAITFLVALATVFLLVDMNRRVRRTRYTQEIREKLEAEAAAENEADDARDTNGTAADGTGPPRPGSSD
jgi:hypothetical protein